MKYLAHVFNVSMLLALAGVFDAHSIVDTKQIMGMIKEKGFYSDQQIIDRLNENSHNGHWFVGPKDEDYMTNYEPGARPGSDYPYGTIFAAALYHGRCELAKVLLEHGASVADLIRQSERMAQVYVPAFRYAIYSCPEVAMLMIEKGVISLLAEKEKNQKYMLDRPYTHHYGERKHTLIEEVVDAAEKEQSNDSDNPIRTELLEKIKAAVAELKD